jgi:Inositol 1,3,4-trisphosphate 5/6-kinase ATP-grasp domain/Inositol 1,3,4-trisphosphate 5/6-kinase pre-ATP-grasp domain
MVEDDTSCQSFADATGSVPSHVFQNPILVGYAFGVKKMNTMATVMAEASRARIVGVVSIDEIDTKAKPPNTLTSAALFMHQKKVSQHPNQILLPSDGLNNILRYFRSSCSSGESDDEFGSNTSTTETGTLTMETRKTFSSHPSNSSIYPVRVSFVPIDLNEPLEDQHGGRFDVILHKMTEDILCSSTTEFNSKQYLEDRGADFSGEIDYDLLLKQATQRILRLKDYQRSNPKCCLVDDPSNVEVLMSRSAIASKLKLALVGVTSVGGLEVSSPRFVDYCQSNQIHSLRYPLIAKPIPAAGTKRSHCMGIVLNSRGLTNLEMPCLLQEYANHRAILFKVYVLGDEIHVFSRLSLPDLPTDSSELESLLPFVEFDSQRPYPTRNNFGLKEDR